MARETKKERLEREAYEKDLAENHIFEHFLQFGNVMKYAASIDYELTPKGKIRGSINAFESVFIRFGQIAKYYVSGHHVLGRFVAVIDIENSQDVLTRLENHHALYSENIKIFKQTVRMFDTYSELFEILDDLELKKS